MSYGEAFSFTVPYRGKKQVQTGITDKKPKENKMTNEELYQLMKDGFDQVKANFAEVNQRLDGMDTRLRTVENGIAELKGKQSAIAGMRSWIVTACAIGALIISIVVAIFK